MPRKGSAALFDHRKGEPKVIITMKYNGDSEHLADEVVDTLRANDNLVVFTVDTDQGDTIILHIFEEDE
jgi:hypothetical protein